MTPTGQRGNARLLRRIVGGPPENPPGKVSSAIFLLVFVVGVLLAVLSWWGDPSLSDLAIACVMLGIFLFAPANPAAYRLWWGELTWDLVRLGGESVVLRRLGPAHRGDGADRELGVALVLGVRPRAVRRRRRGPALLRPG